ncbi:serine hydrolase [Chitinophaga sancti]|uniref:Beta-lactamase class A n=1 Tax=Chitinophaga sancti TaxID=1004 RepID=A0A1K1SWV4_9BACT|nr:serine hydrolase [Chitinophaga sancti]WQD63138.1 serine hydrolase [Chitinophaga sancti]WQG91237.1 serine hydrolase [Chitinophaga sancti]SFW88771.1 beta-lactamase class A [Chitinophaga sancti]
MKYLFLLLLIPSFAFAQHDQKLEKGLHDVISGFRGDVGIYVRNLKTGHYAEINADSIFPTASIVKVPILVGVFDKIEKGELQYHQPLVYRDSARYGGSGIMQYFKDSAETELSVLLALMMSYSDNTASLWNQALAGGGERINQLMEQYGMQVTRVNSRTAGRQEIWKIYGWGMTTPREMATLMLKIRNGEVVSKAASERMYRLMTHPYYDEGAISAIPPYVQAAHKSGAIDASRSEVVYVNAPHGEYVFYVGTKNIVDQSWTDDNEASTLIIKVSKYLWEYFEKKKA